MSRHVIADNVGMGARRPILRRRLWALTGLVVSATLIVGGLDGLTQDVRHGAGFPVARNSAQRVQQLPLATRVTTATGIASPGVHRVLGAGGARQPGVAALGGLTRTTGRAVIRALSQTPRRTPATADTVGSGGSTPQPTMPTATPVVFHPGGDADGDGLDNTTEIALGTDPHQPDSDADGVPDGWEQKHGLDALDALDGIHDPDGDGVPNHTEYELQQDPLAADSDGNGVADGGSDSDGDGVTDAAEIAAGTDPTVPDLPVEPPAPPSGHVTPAADAAAPAAPVTP